MPTLRDHVKETLAAREPDGRDARDDLEALLERTDRPRRAWRYPVVVGPLAVAAVVVLIVTRRGPDVPPRPEPVASNGGVHLYLHVEGEPESRALALDLTVKGAPR